MSNGDETSGTESNKENEEKQAKILKFEKTQKQKNDSEKISLYDLHVNAMAHFEGFLGDFAEKEKIYILQTNAGGRFFVKKTTTGIKRITNEIVRTAISSYCNSQSMGTKFAYLNQFYTQKQKNELMLFWFDNCRRQLIYEKDILPVTFLGDERPSWCVLPFAYVDTSKLDIDKECPTWSEIMNRTTNSEAMIQFLGSIIVPDSDLQQYLWLYGTGMNGKSSITSVLKILFGKSAGSMRCERNQMDKHWAAEIIGRRIVIIPDTKNYQFPTSGLFKSLTGGDTITVPVKYAEPIEFLPTAKFIFTSNATPNIGGETADYRRAIFCHLGTVTAPQISTSDYQALLLAEAPKFLSWCVYQYLGLNPKRGTIAVVQEVNQDLIDDNEEELAESVETWLSIAPGNKMSIGEMLHFLRLAKIKDRAEKHRMIQYLERLGIKKVRPQIDKKRLPREYRGASLNSKALSSIIF